MNSIEKLENAIGEIINQVEENTRIDRISKEKLVESITALWTITGEIKENRDNTWEKLNDVLSKL